jgi:PAS domain S-box-containing protein
MPNKILIVDDEPNNLDVLDNCLEEAGFEVRIANSGKTALKQAAYIKPDLILLDVMMPDMDGFETCLRLKQNQATQDIPVIFLTAKINPFEKVKGLEIGAVDYITKPFETEEVIARVNKHLTISNLRQKLEVQNAQLQDYVFHLESLTTLWKTTNEAQDMAQMMENAMKVTLSRFKCDRAWLLYPCDPNAPSWRVPIEVTTPEYPGANILNIDIPMDPTVSENMRDSLSARGPIAFGGPNYEHKVALMAIKQFSVQSQICMAIYPKVGLPWLFGIHQCSYARIWTKNELNLFSDFGRQISESLGVFLSLEELQKSEERFRGYFESALVGLAITSLEKSWIYTNDCVCEMLGYSREELKELSWAELTYPDDLAAEVAQFEQLLAGELSSYTMDKRFIRKEGTIVYVFLSVTARYQKNGAIAHIVSTLQDITKRKQAEESVQKERDKSLSILNAIPSGVFMVNKQYGIEYINQIIEQEFGSVNGRKCYSYFHNRTEVCPWCKNEKVFAGESVRWEWYFSKSCKHYELFEVPIKNVDGSISKIEIFHDITARKQAEKALQKSYDRFTTVTNSLDAVIYVADLETYELLFINQYGMDIWGSDAIGKPCWQVLQAGQTGPCPFCTNDKLLDQEGKPTGVYVWAFQNTVDGEWYLCRDQAIQWTDGRLVRMEVATNITERKKTEIALIEAKDKADSANRAKSEFLANMSHEIRTPMNAVIGFSDILASEVTDKKQKSHLNSIQVAGKSLLTLINDILDLSKIEAGRLDIQYEPVNPRIIFTELQQIFSLKIAEKNLELIMEIDENLPPALFLDETRLRQVLFNLIGNAIKFTDSGYVKLCANKIDIEDDHSKVDLILTVEDSGIGIPSDQQALIFDSFKQQDGQSTSKYGGTGLGLTITKRLVEMMNGQISVESNPGKGSRFEITLRKVEMAYTTPNVKPDNTFSLNSITFEKAQVLVVDDIESNRRLIEEYLSQVNLEVISAENGQSALLFAKEYHPALILMDIRMPEMDGYEATKHLKANPNTADIPIIALTAAVALNKKAKIEAHGFDGYLSKPVNVSKLLSELSHYIKYTKKAVADVAKVAKTEVDTLNPEEIANLPELRNKLKQEVMPLWKKTNLAIRIDVTNELAEKMIELGNEYNVPAFIYYGESLLEYTKTFKIAYIQKAIKELPILVKPLMEDE